MKSAASQSSSSGWLGSSPCEPKSSTVLTSPEPKYICQKRLTDTRAVKGFEGSTSHRAKPSRSLFTPSGRGGRHGLFEGKSARINPHVVDVPVKTPVNPAERADAEGFVRLERLIEVIEKDPQFRRFSVDVDLDAAGDPGAVVGRQDVMPPAS